MTYLRVPSSKSIILWEIPALGAVPDEFKAYEGYASIRQSSAKDNHASTHSSESFSS
jgi:hypothetical protein